MPSGSEAYYCQPAMLHQPCAGVSDGRTGEARRLANRIPASPRFALLTPTLPAIVIKPDLELGLGQFEDLIDLINEELLAGNPLGLTRDFHCSP